MFDHPNIVKYVESYEDNRYMYIVMEDAFCRFVSITEFLIHFFR